LKKEYSECRKGSEKHLTITEVEKKKTTIEQTAEEMVKIKVLKK
jgi:hypothetical protein